MKQVRVGIVGVTGYAGQEVLRLLLRHPGARITYLASSGKGDPGAALRAFGRLPVLVDAFDAAKCGGACDTAFLGLPHKVSAEAVPTLLDWGTRILDLSAAFRLKDAALYPKHYEFDHGTPSLLAKAVYGLPELYRKALRGAKLVAVPGCYPTGALLAVTPLLRKRIIAGPVILDSKSGVTGAGKEARGDLMFCEVNENVKAYGVFSHRHAPEIGQELGKAAGRRVEFIFTPHLIPMNRGILTTAYVRLKPQVDRAKVLAVFADVYRTSPFVRVLAEGLPDTRSVRGTNYCDIGVAVRGRDAIVVSAIDNLGKGAAGEAVQAFNLVHGFPETLGLLSVAGAP
ncbi:MAG: N-acetyl-gamma-glutamyl-phosphate reductase [Candidatus Coatesbacteria bacterium]